jgi:hypothetical protein
MRLRFGSFPGLADDTEAGDLVSRADVIHHVTLVMGTARSTGRVVKF